jgi:hypothetical protein
MFTILFLSLFHAAAAAATLPLLSRPLLPLLPPQ